MPLADRSLLMLALRTATLIIAFIATTAPIAHVLEMISKLTLDGPLWLGVQQHLYRGWGGIWARRDCSVPLNARLTITHMARSFKPACLSHSRGVLRCYAGRLIRI